MVTPSALRAGAALALILVLVGCSPTTVSDETSSDDSSSSGPAEETPATSAVPTLTDAPAAGGPSMALSADAITPSTLTISVGDVVTFTSGDGGVHGLVINSLSSVSVAPSLEEYYLFTEAGTYLVSDELSSATATITVE